MMMLYTVRSLSRCHWLFLNFEELTIATFFKAVPELGLQAKVESPFNIIILFPAHFAPLSDDFRDHVGVHRHDTEPKDPLVPLVSPVLGQLEQSDSKGSFAKGLVDERPTRSNGDENMHAVIPGIGYITSCKLKRYEAVIDG